MCLNSLLFKTKAFSLIELLTSVSVIGTLSVIGIKSYQSQTNKARTAEAKQSLSYLYTAQRSFYNNWNTYHENLMVVGAAPSGLFYYDIGFSNSGSMSTTDGDLGEYPEVVSGVQILNIQQCSNFYQICEDECLDEIASNVKSVNPAYEDYFSSTGSYRAKADCKVESDLLIKDHTDSASEATETTFKALATGELKNTDIWSINQQQVVTHEQDGTQ